MWSWFKRVTFICSHCGTQQRIPLRRIHFFERFHKLCDGQPLLIGCPQCHQGLQTPGPYRTHTGQEVVVDPHNLPKDDCQYRCLDYPDGLTLSTQDDARFLTLNGIQTQSARTFNLLPELGRLAQLGVDVIRVAPQSSQTAHIIGVFHRCLHGEQDPVAGSAELERFMPVGPCDGYWYGEAGVEARNPSDSGNATTDEHG